MRIEKLLPIRSGCRSYKHQLRAQWVGLPLLGTRSSTNNKVGESCNTLQHPQSLATNLETFHFPETVQVLSNPTPITQRVTSTSNRNALNYATSLAIRLRESSKIPTCNKRNIALTSLPHSLDQHQKQKDETLDSSSVLILFS